ncbi:MAG: ABC transporter ATP-binding protein [Candidatus Pacebacteria bacterium]|nr:ABC transporter ATP-binding protein [Candidatus Paceibacterota bacterium]
MNYKLNNGKDKKISSAFKKLLELIMHERKSLSIAMIATVVCSFAELSTPMIIGYAIDNYIKNKDIHGLMISGIFLFLMYLVWMVFTYVQNMMTGMTGRKVLFDLRNKIFKKLQSLPISFFNQNKNGDLISRMNNDTDKLNLFFSQSLVQAMRNVFIILGALIIILILNPSLGLVAIIPAVIILIISVLLSSINERVNAKNLQSLGGLSSEIQESLLSFKVIIAFNRQDYFLKKFNESNENNFKASVKADIMNKTFIPLFDLASNVGQLSVLCYGAYLVSTGSITVGLLITYILYLAHFYDPLKHLAVIWPSFQIAMTALNRIYEILNLKSNIRIIPGGAGSDNDHFLEFKDVSFCYEEGKYVLKDMNIQLNKGKTYAFVGPTGGGKTTTASLMARLYDPTEGVIYLEGKDIRSYEHKDLSRKIGFILQDAFLFSGTIKENILYGNDEYASYTDEQLAQLLKDSELDGLLEKFSDGLRTVISPDETTISLGEKQLIAFMRAVLRKPELLILDEATANIDTVTEQFLEKILSRLPKETIKVIIAHRLNTIEGADTIFFVNSGKVVKADSMQMAVDMLINEKRES